MLSLFLVIAFDLFIHLVPASARVGPWRWNEIYAYSRLLILYTLGGL
jgi:hypothetical protein